jgi:hypothetical protein
MTRQTATSQTFLLSKPGRKHSVRCFAPLQPEHVSSRQRVHEAVAQPIAILCGLATTNP